MLDKLLEGYDKTIRPDHGGMMQLGSVFKIVNRMYFKKRRRRSTIFQDIDTCYVSRAVPCLAVPYRAVPCSVVSCRAVPCRAALCHASCRVVSCHVSCYEHVVVVLVGL